MAESVRQQLLGFFGKFTEIKYGKKEYILRSEDEPQGVYFIKSGYVKQVFLDESGKSLILNIYKPGAYFPMMWALGGMKNHDFFEAMTAVTVYRAPKEKVVKWLRQHPELLFELTQRLAIGLGGLVYRLEDLFFAEARRRVAGVLVMAGKRFGKKKTRGEVLIKLTLTHQEIADLAGLSRETTSLEMGKFAGEGLIRYQSRAIMIKTWDNLRKIADGEV